MSSTGGAAKDAVSSSPVDIPTEPSSPAVEEAFHAAADDLADEDQPQPPDSPPASLAAHEEKWGFTLTELQAATKVVRTLFHNPSLYLGDPYLADSRLYTMITRDRKNKREHRDVYKAIMNEEKSRRKRYQRMQDIEAVRKTAMKREREDALNALMLPDAPQSPSPPLLLCERPEVAPQAPMGAGVWSDSEKELLRLIGAFENLLRLEEAFRGEAVEEPTVHAAQRVQSTNLGRAAHLGTPRTEEETERDAVNSCDEASRVKQRRLETADTQRELDWLLITHLTAQVYRYLPHAFGSQMPPPLFTGDVAADATAEQQRQYITGMKLFVARQAAMLVSLQASTGETLSGTSAGVPTTLQMIRHISQDVLVRRYMPLLCSYRQLRSWMCQSPSVSDDGALSSCALPEGSISTIGDALRSFEVVLVEGGSDERFSPALEEKTTAAATCSFQGPRFSARQVADQSLNLFIARRLYQSRRLLDCGESPVDVPRGPPTSESVEPDSFCIFDEVQRYACEHHYDDAELQVSKWLSCHTCKVRYNRLHPFYYSMCHLCGEYNYNKRLMARDLRGKVVLMTGCRIKIGYAMTISLLRCGATVLGTTRFAHEAIARFRAEPDYATWRDRLHLFSLDLRDMWVVTQFCAYVQQKFPKLFAIVNNAAQTIARTPQYTERLRRIEINPAADLREALTNDAVAAEWHTFFLHHTSVTVGQALTIECHPHDKPFLPTDCTADEAEDDVRSLLSPTPAEGVSTRTNVVPQQQAGVVTTTSSYAEQPLVFDRYDTHAEESDHREQNSWVMKLAEVQGSEAAEVMAINALSPFIINGKLKPCLTNRTGDAVGNEPRFIINVSAMEGQFYRFKQTTHPHTNMAKAALNMMTRTSADDYAQDGIYMNSVDTGWITDESPKLKKERRADQYLLCPLDEVDAAARCLDLIYTNNRVHGKFFKDFKEIAW